MGVNEGKKPVKKPIRKMENTSNPFRRKGFDVFKRSAKGRASVLQHAVSDAEFGVDVPGFGGVLLEFAADVGHVDTEDLVAVVAAVWAPDVLQNEVVGQHLPGVDVKWISSPACVTWCLAMSMVRSFTW